jgi:small conductance mechanosensitive channel
MPLQDQAPGEGLVHETAWAERGLQWALTYAPALLGALITFVVGRWLARLAASVLRRLLTARRVDPTLTGFLCNLAYFAGLTLVIIASVGKLGVETTSFVAILGAATLALGLALQSTLADVAAGVLLIFFRPFRVGDYVETAGGNGTVEEIGIFVTHLTTADNRVIIVPNSAITKGAITNFSAKETRRVDLTFAIGYGDDILLAKEVLAEICRTEPRILADPPAEIAVSALGDSAVQLVCRPWVKTPDCWDVSCDLRERAKRAFDARGITMPFPQREVRLVRKA